MYKILNHRVEYLVEKDDLPSSCHWLQKPQNFQARGNKDEISTYHALLHLTGNWCNFQLLYIRNVYDPLSVHGVHIHPAPALVELLLCILHWIIKVKYKSNRILWNYKIIHDIQHKRKIRCLSQEKKQNSKDYKGNKLFS